MLSLSLSARAVRASSLRAVHPPCSTASLGLITRRYASKKPKGKGKGKEEPSKASKSREGGGDKYMRSTASLIPASQKAVSDAAQAEYDKCKERMDAAIQWFRKECATLEGRATGRVTPALLAPIRVKIPGVGEGLKMEEVATVGVKDGSMLVVTLFEEGSYKHVEDAILSARLPGITPQKYDTRTIRIPIPKPTVEARAALYTTAATQAEDVRNQIRKHRITAVKHGEYDKHSEEFEAFQKLADKSIEEVDKILANLKKVTSPK